MSLFGGGATSSQPTPQKVYPVDLLQTELAGLKADQYGYNLSDQNLPPGMIAAQKADFTKAYQELTGPLAPEVQNEFATRGLEKSLSSFGGGSESADVTGKGSIGRNTAATSVASDTSAYQDAARSYIDQFIESERRPFGLSGGDMLNLAILNQGNLAQANQQAAGFASSLGAAQAQASQAGTSAAIGAGTSLLAAAAPAIIAAVH